MDRFLENIFFIFNSTMETAGVWTPLYFIHVLMNSIILALFTVVILNGTIQILLVLPKMINENLVVLVTIALAIFVVLLYVNTLVLAYRLGCAVFAATVFLLIAWELCCKKFWFGMEEQSCCLKSPNAVWHV